MRRFILIFIVVACCESIHGQDAPGDTDSLQRVVMKDSLSVNDSVINQVFAIRNNFLVQSTQVNGNTQLTEQERSAARQALITDTNTGIRNVLGETAYEHYQQMIRRRMAGRPGMAGLQPLASQGN